MLQLGALSKSENFTVVTLWPGNTNRTIKIIKVAILVAKVTKVMTVTVINQTVSREMSKYLCSNLVYHVILTNIPSVVT